MPRTKGFTNEQKIEHQRELLSDRLDLLLYKNKIPKKKVAEYVGISNQALCKQFRDNVITIPVLMAVITLTDAEAGSVEKMLKIGG